tara:strand:- start:490 stop:669 length:180 start_codon:yes stop_codon:yes gene_type:complete
MKNLLLIIIFLLIICIVVKKEESFNNIKSINKNKNNKKNIVLKNSVGHFNIYIPSIKHD